MFKKYKERFKLPNLKTQTNSYNYNDNDMFASFFLNIQLKHNQFNTDTRLNNQSINIRNC